ncbi:MAG: polysulfide reductase NrfD [Anaerolineales bacterium]|nr:polysulfide reductase NrfD [Anaerolineales bacterium]
MNYGFLIDNRKCIGCHACSIACKSENEVPLGVNRTWVKYTEKGVFPDTRRYFQVTRCNHCANPPCVRICPTTAMYQRPDGIVEFDPARCIGCKACMQACPYDAIYMDPGAHTAAKCHYCAHRVEVGLEPACVIVCPEHAIVAGDVDDPASEIARLLATQPVRVRKPEQGTKPKLFYVDAEEASIVPMQARQDGGMLWADWPKQGPGDWRGPIHSEDGRLAAALLRSAAGPRETYNVPQRIPWHWPVPAYLVTKSIGAGTFIVSAVGLSLGWLGDAPAFTTVAGFLSLVFIGLTTLLLVADLDRPERFWTILVRPQWRSWLARGAFILIGFSAIAGLYWLALVFGRPDLARWLTWPGVVLAALAAVYTAFLFAQAEGRDSWQSSSLPLHLLAQTIQAGAATLLVVSALLFPNDRIQLLNPGYGGFVPLAWIFALSLCANLLFTAAEHSARHPTGEAAAAARLMQRGGFARWYWGGVLAGIVLPLVLAAMPALLAPGAGILGREPLDVPWPFILAAVLSLAGLFAYEWAFVMAPQDVPNN